MRVLFVHQVFPGQYTHVAKYLVDHGHEVVALAQHDRPIPPGIRRILYRRSRDPSPHTHHYLHEAEAGILNGQAVARACMALKAEGFRPDIMIGHSAWGETLFLKDLWPNVPLLGYFEFFYHSHGDSAGFDPEYPLAPDDEPRIRVKNTLNLLGLDAADWGQTPTQWQRSRYPAASQPRLSVIHEGVDTQVVVPNPRARAHLPNGRLVQAGEEIITFVSRHLEPYRGFHVFMRSLPEILRRRPLAQILIVGAEGSSYGQRLPANDSYLKRLKTELGERLDLKRVVFLGSLAYGDYLKILQLSAVHIYLTYPFVLSWSAIEALSAGCLVIGSATAPVQEVLRDGINGLLVDFFDHKGLADRIDEVLDHPDRMAELRAAARRTAVERFDMATQCLPPYLHLLERLASGGRPDE